MAKQQKTVVKIAVALISVLGMTAIGVGSTLAGANKQDQRGNYTVECQGYTYSNYYSRYQLVTTQYISNSRCNSWKSKNHNGYYWVNAGL